MIKFFSNSTSKFAVVTSIHEEKYTLEVFNSEQEFLNCSKSIESFTLNGQPNIADIKSKIDAIAADFINHSDEDLPIGPFIPRSISARQIRLWLVEKNIELDYILSLIESIEDIKLRKKTLIEWEYAPYIERDHPMLVPLAQSLGLNETDIDRAFTEANVL